MSKETNNKVPVDKRQFLLDRIDDDYYEKNDKTDFDGRHPDTLQCALITNSIERTIVYNIVKNLSKSKIRSIYADFRALPKTDKRSLTAFVVETLDLTEDIANGIELICQTLVKEGSCVC